MVEEQESLTNKKVSRLKEYRSSLFDKEHNVKPWKANELRFLDAKITLLEESLKRLQNTDSDIITNMKLLKRKVSAESDTACESKRKQRSQTEKNEMKTEKEQVNIDEKGRGGVVNLIR